ncbi:MAG: thioredoxin family protein [Gammaproteobacteria bacterium]|nr:thioredoxin family protein [Gammaproteobacteria bacterium]
MLAPYCEKPPDRATLDVTPGPLVLEFGSNDCGICRAALPLITEAMAGCSMPHHRIQDGKGRRLGRTFAVKLWPTLIMLRDGKEVARVVRPTTVDEIVQALQVFEE